MPPRECRPPTVPSGPDAARACGSNPPPRITGRGERRRDEPHRLTGIFRKNRRNCCRRHRKTVVARHGACGGNGRSGRELSILLYICQYRHRSPGKTAAHSRNRILPDDARCLSSQKAVAHRQSLSMRLLTTGDGIMWGGRTNLQVSDAQLAAARKKRTVDGLMKAIPKERIFIHAL